MRAGPWEAELDWRADDLLGSRGVQLVGSVALKEARCTGYLGHVVREVGLVGHMGKLCVQS